MLTFESLQTVRRGYLLDGELVELHDPRYAQIVDHIAQNDAQAAARSESLSYLARTDWYVVRHHETGAVIPADVVTARAEARAAVV